MAEPVSMQELLIANLAQTDAIAELLVEKGLVTREKILSKVSEQRAIDLSTDAESYAAMN
jgi:hypothetical protein